LISFLPQFSYKNNNKKKQPPINQEKQLIDVYMHFVLLLLNHDDCF